MKKESVWATGILKEYTDGFYQERRAVYEHWSSSQCRISHAAGRGKGIKTGKNCIMVYYSAGYTSAGKEKLEKSLKYNVWSSLIRFVVLYFIFSCIWIFGVGRYDPFESVTGYRLMGKRTVTAVVQEDGMSASVKDPNEGEHIIYNLTDLGIDPTGYTYGDRLNTYWSRDEESNVYRLLTVLPEKKASHIECI